MKEYLLNCSSIRLDYDLLVFSSRFLLPKLKVFDIWKKELSNFHELLESARARASFENWFCVESRVTAFTGKKNQVKRLLSRWSTTLFRCTCLHGHWIKEFFKLAKTEIHDFCGRAQSVGLLRQHGRLPRARMGRNVRRISPQSARHGKRISPSTNHVQRGAKSLLLLIE